MVTTLVIVDPLNYSEVPPDNRTNFGNVSSKPGSLSYLTQAVIYCPYAQNDNILFAICQVSG